MKKQLLFITFVLHFFLSNAQQLTPQLICSGSGNITNGTSSMSWTIGETVIETMHTSSFQLTNGVGQPDFKITAVLNNVSPIELKLFPNPTKDFLILQATHIPSKNLIYSLLDGNGKIISTAKIADEKTIIDFTHLTTANYVLSIMDDANQVIQSYKIIKQ